MGYDLRITRAQDWQKNGDCPIGEVEWQSIVQSDPDLVPDPQNGPNAVTWAGSAGDGGEPAWLDWARGNIYTTNPSPELAQKMFEIARSLDARVQGDEKEIYESTHELAECAWARQG